MSPDIAPAVFTPDTDAVGKLVASALVPIASPSIGSQYLCRYSRRLIDRFTFVQLLYPFLTDFIHQRWTLSAFYPCRSVPTPWKGSTAGWIGNVSSKTYPRDQFKVSLVWTPLISFKVMMNQFQRTYSLINRKFCIFESALIHRRTH